MENLYSGPELKDLSIQVIQEDRAQKEVKILEQRLAELRKELEQAEAEKNKEVKESEDAKNNVFMRLLFSSKVDKEELEAYAATERYDLALEAYEVVKSQLHNAKSMLAKFAGCKEKYEKKYAAKRNALLAEKGEDADKILELEKEIDMLTIKCKNAKRTLDVCNEAFETAILILNRMGAATYTAEMDPVFSNKTGNVFDLSTTNNTIGAINLAKELKELLKKLRREMQIIALCVEIRDACLDFKNNDDWVRVIGARNKTLELNSLDTLQVQITEMTDDISRSRKEIEAQIKDCEMQLKTKKKELEQIIF